jgi:hypothetical protein
VTIEVKGENPQITKYKLLTFDELVKMYKNMDAYINRVLRYSSSCTMRLFYVPDIETFKLSSQTNYPGNELVSVIFQEYPKQENKDSCYRARKMMNALWDREFPLHVKVKSLEDVSRTCGELLDWLNETKNYHITTYHEHTDACYEDGKRTCQMYEELLYPVNRTTESLLFEFFGINKGAFNAEKDRMVRELKDG